MSSSQVCSKGEKTCVKNADGTCTTSKMCTIETPDGPKDCECICKCNCKSGSCENCKCQCNCTLETAQKIVTAEGIKYRCECTCDC